MVMRDALPDLIARELRIDEYHRYTIEEAKSRSEGELA